MSSPFTIPKDTSQGHLKAVQNSAQQDSLTSGGNVGPVAKSVFSELGSTFYSVFSVPGSLGQKAAQGTVDKFSAPKSDSSILLEDGSKSLANPDDELKRVSPETSSSQRPETPVNTKIERAVGPLLKRIKDLENVVGDLQVGYQTAVYAIEDLKGKHHNVSGDIEGLKSDQRVSDEKHSLIQDRLSELVLSRESPLKEVDIDHSAAVKSNEATFEKETVTKV